MKIIVYKTAEFDYDGIISVKEITIFLMQKGFRNIHKMTIDVDNVIVVAEHCGRNTEKFKKPTTPIPEYYECGIKNIDLDFKNKCAYNAQRLNEICKRNGEER